MKIILLCIIMLALNGCELKPLKTDERKTHKEAVHALGTVFGDIANVDENTPSVQHSNQMIKQIQSAFGKKVFKANPVQFFTSNFYLSDCSATVTPPFNEEIWESEELVIPPDMTVTIAGDGCPITFSLSFTSSGDLKTGRVNLTFNSTYKVIDESYKTYRDVTEFDITINTTVLKIDSRHDLIMNGTGSFLSQTHGKISMYGSFNAKVEDDENGTLDATWGMKFNGFTAEVEVRAIFSDTIEDDVDLYVNGEKVSDDYFDTGSTLSQNASLKKLKEFENNPILSP